MILNIFVYLNVYTRQTSIARKYNIGEYCDGGIKIEFLNF